MGRDTGHSKDANLALVMEHGEGGEVDLRVHPGLGPALVTFHVGPRVHDVVTVTLVVKILVLKAQSYSPAQRKNMLGGAIHTHTRRKTCRNHVVVAEVM